MLQRHERERMSSHESVCVREREDVYCEEAGERSRASVDERMDAKGVTETRDLAAARTFLFLLSSFANDLLYVTIEFFILIILFMRNYDWFENFSLVIFLRYRSKSSISCKSLFFFFLILASIQK